MLAIHTKTGSFPAAWIEYCHQYSIPFKEVDCFSSDIVNQLQGCRALLWHWEHNDYRAMLFARQLIASAEAMGLLVFPGTATSWHYDDKVGQKYLLEAIGAPLIPSHVFYDKKTALNWLESIDLPLVWKLRGGAGAQNVKLVSDRKTARRIIRRSFRQGWKNSRFYAFNERLWQFRRDRSLRAFVNIARGVVRAVIPHQKNRSPQADRNYVYFQEFVPENNFDIRIIVIGKRAFAIKRMVREGDFRASGSGFIIRDIDDIPIKCVRIAFDVTRALKSQSCAFDFVYRDGQWLIIEVSYAFSLQVYVDCPGYWDSDLNWQAGKFSPEEFMIEDVLSELNSRDNGNG